MAKVGKPIANWQDDVNAYSSVRVTEDEPQGVVEYIASTPLLNEDGEPKSTQQINRELTEGIFAQRDSQQFVIATDWLTDDIHMDPPK